MIKKAVTLVSGLILGLLLGYLIFFIILTPKKQKIGFLPYWLLSKAETSYPQINTLTYFGLTIDTDGKILKLQNPQEEEPGWSALRSGKVESFLTEARKNNQALSLLVFNANEVSIAALLQNPVSNAQNLVTDVKPIMQKYKFTDLNLDIESTKEASPEAQLAFQQFVREVKKGIDQDKLGTLTIDIAPDALIHKRLINLADVISYVDFVVLMAYDYHYMGSYVTGPVAPIAGVGTISEYDIETALQKATKITPAKKIILGIPLYGYEWETTRDATRSATIPSTGLTASSKRVQQLLGSCATCSAKLDTDASESFVVFKDSLGTYHQIFFPDQKSTSAKINLAKQQKLAGVAVWALGYEDNKILQPLTDY